MTGALGGNTTVHAGASVAYVIESLGPGGAERQLVEFLQRIDRRRFSVRVLTYHKNEYYKEDIAQISIPIHHIDRRRKFDPRVCLRIAHWLYRREVDIVHGLSETSNFYAVIGRKIAGRGKVVVSELSCHDQAGDLFWRRKSWVHRNADLTTANNMAARRVILARAKVSAGVVRFIPNMIDGSKYFPASPEERLALRRKFGWHDDERVVFTVATFSGYKNHYGIAQAMEGLSAPSLLRFCWVGAEADGVLGKAALAKVSEVGMGDRVQVFSLLPDLADLYRACDVFLLNSVQEGTPNVLLEALACGCPLIATDVSDGGIYAVPGKTGWLVPPDDPASLRRALEEFSKESADQLRAMGHEARRRFLSLGCDPLKVTSQYETIYDELLGKECQVNKLAHGE